MRKCNLEDFRQIPIPKNQSARLREYFSSLAKKKYYFREVISKIPIIAFHRNLNEALDRCIEFGLHEESYYKKGNGALIISHSSQEAQQFFANNIFLRISILRDLQKVDIFLQDASSGRLCLAIMSGFRPLFFQSICYLGVKSQKRSEGAKSPEELFSDPAVYSPHSTGGAFDVEIWDNEKKMILPTKFSDREEIRGSFFLEEFQNLSAKDEEARKNRRLLYNLLASTIILGKDHFIAHPSEYWHFGRNERLSAFFSGDENHKVFYDIVH